MTETRNQAAVETVAELRERRRALWFACAAGEEHLEEMAALDAALTRARVSGHEDLEYLALRLAERLNSYEKLPLFDDAALEAADSLRALLKERRFATADRDLVDLAQLISHASARVEAAILCTFCHQTLGSDSLELALSERIGAYLDKIGRTDPRYNEMVEMLQSDREAERGNPPQPN